MPVGFQQGFWNLGFVFVRRVLFFLFLSFLPPCVLTLSVQDSCCRLYQASGPTIQKQISQCYLRVPTYGLTGDTAASVEEPAGGLLSAFSGQTKSLCSLPGPTYVLYVRVPGRDSASFPSGGVPPLSLASCRSLAQVLSLVEYICLLPYISRSFGVHLDPEPKADGCSPLPMALCMVQKFSADLLWLSSTPVQQITPKRSGSKQQPFYCMSRCASGIQAGLR